MLLKEKEPAEPEISAESTSPGQVAPPDYKWLPYAILALAGLTAAFWTLFKWLPDNWFGDDSYYAHGAVVPICVALIIWDRWDKLKQVPVKGVTLAIIPILATLYVTWFAHRTDMRSFQSILLLFLLAFGVLFVAGWRWLKGLALPIGYLGFALPIFDRFVDSHTQTIQAWSTDLSFMIMKVGGLGPYRAADMSTIIVDDFVMDVGVPCSGMKLLLAVFAISVFFMLIAKLRWYANAILLATIVPLTLVVNSIRIATIGLVGANYGSDAGHQFHDYSGYISLVLCFVLLMKLTKVLGWK